MSIDATNWAWSLQDITSTEKLVLLSYADRAGETMEAWPSKSRLERDTCLSLKTIYKVVNSLVKKGYMIKTGEVNQVPVYRLIGVQTRENLSTSPSNFTRGKNKPTPSKIARSTSSNFTRGTPSKITTQNHNKNPNMNPNRKRPIFSSFVSTAFFLEYIQSQLKELKIAFDDDIIDQIHFYGDKFAHKRDPVDSAHIAFNQLKKKKWNIPHGWRGITSQSIREKDEKQQKEREQQWKEEAMAAKSILSLVQSGKGK